MREAMMRHAYLGLGVVGLAHFLFRPTWESLGVVLALVAAAIIREHLQWGQATLAGKVQALEAAQAEVNKAIQRHGEKLDGLQAAPKATRPPM